jgi:hypothetical protein
MMSKIGKGGLTGEQVFAELDKIYSKAMQPTDETGIVRPQAATDQPE